MHCYCAGPSTGTLQYLDRQPVTTRTDATHRMVDPSRSVTSGVQPLGRAMDRSFCHIQQQEGPAVHISITGSLGSLHWCSVEPYEPDGHCVCLPTIQNHPNSHSQIQTESTTIILIALYRMDTSWMPGLLQLLRDRPIPIHDEHKPLKSFIELMGESRPGQCLNLHKRKLWKPYIASWDMMSVDQKLWHQH